MCAELKKRNDILRHMLYLDNNATTPITPSVKKYFIECLDAFGNASTLYSLGQQADALLELARKRLATSLDVTPEEIIFTSGGTESNNLAIKGAAYANRGKGNHLITSAIEHPSVLNVFNYLQRKGFQVTYLPVTPVGFVDPDILKAALRPETILVSIMAANNETGMIQNIPGLTKIIRAQNPEIIIHTDAVQAFGKISISVKAWDVDLLSISGHKIHAPKGIGCLYVRRGVRLDPLCEGGPQERGLRPGTEPVPLIAALGLAAEEAMTALPAYTQLQDLKLKLLQDLKAWREDIVINGDVSLSLPNTLNITIPGINAEAVVLKLDQAGVLVGNGAACSSGKNESSYVLKAMGVPSVMARSSLRISLSLLMTELELSYFTKELMRVTVKS